MKRFLAASAMLALTLSACQTTNTQSGQNSSAAGTIKLGLIAPLTGDAAGLGADVLHGTQMAIDKINEAGGINGRQIELIAEDGRCTGSEAANAAQKLVSVDHVDAIVGGLCSGETLAAAPIANAGQTVLLSPTSSSPDVTKAGDFVFRNYPSDALKTTAMVAYFKEKGWKKLATITENTDFSQGFRTALKSKLPADAVVFDEVVDPGTKDFRSLLTRMKKLQFDVFFPNGNSDAVIGPMLQQFRDAGFTQTAISHDTADSVTMAKQLPEATEGFQVINVSSDVSDASFSPAFTQKYGDPQYQLAFAAFAYDATMVLANGWKAGATDGPSLRDWMYRMPDYTGVVGTFHFDENGDVVGIPYVLKQYNNGVIKTVKPIIMEGAMMEAASSSK